MSELVFDRRLGVLVAGVLLFWGCVDETGQRAPTEPDDTDLDAVDGSVDAGSEDAEPEDGAVPDGTVNDVASDGSESDVDGASEDGRDGDAMADARTDDAEGLDGGATDSSGGDDVVETTDGGETSAMETDAGGADGADAGTCGDGELDFGEQCDDGNSTNGDGCDNDCTYSCVDDADCDDGNVCNGRETCDTSTHTCQEGADAADGTACDADGDGNDDEVCRSGTCVEPTCGNGTVEGNEECDDGNSTNGDGCDNDCTYSCTSDADCDDGKLCNGQETCDTSTHTCEDGSDAADGTACDADGDGNDDEVCRNGTCVEPTCGNGIVEGNEECDDGNSTNGDGCDNDCTYSCTSDADCDDGNFCNGQETCDTSTHTCQEDANEPDGTACDADGDGNDDEICLSGSCVESTCGDGYVDSASGEECDDGNTTTGDGCTANCKLPTAFRVDEADLVDPHLYVETDAFSTFCVCEDATSFVNGELQSRIDAYDTNVAEVFRPLDLAQASTPMDVYSDAQCNDNDTDGTASCSPGTRRSQGRADNEVGTNATCFSHDTSRTNVNYSDPNSPSAPCFSRPRKDVTIDLGGCSLELQDTVIASEYSSNSSPSSLQNGVISGFLTTSEAQSCSIDSQYLCNSPRTLYEILDDSDGCGVSADRDSYNGTDGWWFYINVPSASEANWSQ